MVTAQITGSPSSFSLTSTWYCYGSPDSNGYYQSISTATTATQDVTFDISSIPSNAIVSSAYIYAAWSSPAYGFNIRRINNTTCPTDGTTNITISSSQLSSGSVSATFKFQSLTSPQMTTSTKTGITTISGVYLCIEYSLPYTACTAPTNITVSPVSVDPGGSSTLSWSGAVAGSSNPITGYHIYISDSAYGTYSKLSEISTTETSGSVIVTAPSTNGSAYYYRIYTIGTVSGYDSDISSVYATLACSYSSPAAPTNVHLLKSISTGDNTTLTWTAGSDGVNNPIALYVIYYRDSNDGVNWTQDAMYVSVSSDVTSYLAPKPEVGYYRKYIICAVGTVSNTYSDWIASVNSIYRYDGEFTDDPLVAGETHIKAVHMTELQELASIICGCYDCFDISFSSITAGVTSLANWSQHVREIRQAVDDLGIDHEDWIDISENRPSVSVMEQLRSVLISI